MLHILTIAVRQVIIACIRNLKWLAWLQSSTITIKSPHVCLNFGVGDARGQIPKSIYEASSLLPSDFPNNS